jgi:ssDNA-binding Zn-finger/Zn-ribbon topoisomerase 1
MKCPYCGMASLPILPTKEWNYRNEYYHVKAYECPKCGKKFREYYHCGNLKFTIPKLKK